VALAAQCQLAVQPGEPTSGPQGFVSALALDAQGQPVVGGDFLVADGSLCQRIARWNGSSWQPLGSGVDANVGAIARLPNGDLVAGGSFAIAGGQPAAAVARWNGTAWSPMGAGLPGRVTALEVAGNGDVWAGISVQDIASVHRFDGAVWQQVGTDFSAGLIQDLAELPNGDWVAGGLIGTAGGLPAVARTVTWCSGAPCASATRSAWSPPSAPRARRSCRRRSAAARPRSACYRTAMWSPARSCRLDRAVRR
jgi:hypothetical protein